MKKRKKARHKKSRKKALRKPILAAGGIVLRGGRSPRIAVVRLRKLGQWVLPKGKLSKGEDAVAAAMREVIEETGHKVSVHEFVGTISYDVGRRTKVVQFWRMQARGSQAHPLMRDVTAIRWLPLAKALRTLTHRREQAFLAQAGPIAIEAAQRMARRRVTRPHGKRHASVATITRHGRHTKATAMRVPRAMPRRHRAAAHANVIEKVRGWLIEQREPSPKP
jgi:8-oxo-dGTP diphosphatase